MVVHHRSPQQMRRFRSGARSDARAGSSCVCGSRPHAADRSDRLRFRRELLLACPSWPWSDRRRRRLNFGVSGRWLQTHRSTARLKMATTIPVDRQEANQNVCTAPSRCHIRSAYKSPSVFIRVICGYVHRQLKDRELLKSSQLKQFNLASLLI